MDITILKRRKKKAILINLIFICEPYSILHIAAKKGVEPFRGFSPAITPFTVLYNIARTFYRTKYQQLQ